MSDEPLIPLEGEQKCKSCGCILPIGAFRRLIGGEPTLPRYHHTCKPCEKREKKQTAEVEQQKKMFLSFVREVNKSEHDDVPHIAELAGAVLKKFGGVDGLADELKNFDRDIKSDDKRKGSATHLNLYKMILKLTLSATEHRDAPNVQNKSDEELLQAMWIYFEKHQKNAISDLWQTLPKESVGVTPQLPTEPQDDTVDLYEPEPDEDE